MGGLAGHLQHVYEDIGLTFGELKDILRDASTGRLESVTEKLDGQNIFFGYRGGALRFARNLGDLRRGGMTGEEVDRKWLDKPSVQAAFSQAYDVLSKAVQVSMSHEEKVAVFGDRGEYWFSAEILSVANPNIIVYGQNVISPHLFGARKFNETTGHLEDQHDDAVFEKLLEVAAKLDVEMSESNWKLSAPVVYPLVKLGSQQPLKEALLSIDQIMGEVPGMTDESTVGDFIKAKLSYYVKPYGIGDDVVGELGKRMTDDSDKVARINQLRKMATDEEQYIRIVALDRNKKKIFKAITKPIEDVITKFASELLEGSKSMLVADHSAASGRIRSELSMAIEKIKSSPDALAVLGDQLNKLQGADRITSTIEGIVFRRGGKSYKFTGQFAPINQLIGALRYGGRGYDDEEGFVLRRKPNADLSVTIFPGAFKPFQKGHDRVVRLASMQTDKVHLVVSDSDREKPGEVPILRGTMQQVWDRYIKQTLPANVQVEFADNPVSKAFELLRGYDESGRNVQVNLLAGDEDVGRFRAEAVAADAPRLYSSGLVDIVSVPRFGGVSGTDMRSFIALGDKAKFVGGMPDALADHGGEIFDLLRADGLQRVRELIAQQQQQAKLAVPPTAKKSKKPVLEVLSQGTQTENRTTMVTPSKAKPPTAAKASVKMNMKDLAKLVKESLKESLAEAAGDRIGPSPEHAKMPVAGPSGDWLSARLGGNPDYAKTHAAVSAQQRWDGMSTEEQEPIFAKLFNTHYGSGGMRFAAFPAPAQEKIIAHFNSLQEDVSGAIADDNAAAADMANASEEMVMEAIAAAYRAGLKKGRTQSKLFEQEMNMKAVNDLKAKIVQYLQKALNSGYFGAVEFNNFFGRNTIVKTLKSPSLQKLVALSEKAAAAYGSNNQGPNVYYLPQAPELQKVVTSAAEEVRTLNGAG